MMTNKRQNAKTPKKVVCSIHAQCLYQILIGEKHLEYRMNKPRCKLPFEMYFYLTKNNKYTLDYGYDQKGKYEFDIFETNKNPYWNYKKSPYPNLLEGKIVARCIVRACISTTVRGYKYAWRVDKVKFLEKPCLLRGKAPQSWKYINDEDIVEVV